MLATAGDQACNKVRHSRPAASTKHTVSCLLREAARLIGVGHHLAGISAQHSSTVCIPCLSTAVCSMQHAACSMQCAVSSRDARWAAC